MHKNFQYVGLRGMRLEKYRLFYVALALCFSVSLVGGWLNESFGQRLRYQRERAVWLWGGGGGRGGGRQERRKTNLYLWLLDSSRTLLHSDVCLPPATYSM